MVEQNSVENVEKKYKQIRIKRDGEIITLKIEKEYNSSNFNYNDKKNIFFIDDPSDDNTDIINYVNRLSNDELVNLINSLNENKSKIFKIVLEDSNTPGLIRSMYNDKFGELITPEITEKCSKADNERECQNHEMPQLYDILVVKTEDIIPDVSQGGTRRRRNNKKNKRKTRNNRKKTNRRR